MTGAGKVGLAEGNEANVALASEDGNAVGPRMKCNVGRSSGKGAGRKTGPASAEQAKARPQTHRVRLMASG